MSRAIMSPDTYVRKAAALRPEKLSPSEAQALSVQRAVIETIRNPIVARAVAHGLRHLVFEKP